MSLEMYVVALQSMFNLSASIVLGKLIHVHLFAERGDVVFEPLRVYETLDEGLMVGAYAPPWEKCVCCFHTAW